MKTDEEGYTVPDMTGITAENCTVHFGDWNDYYYCELVANSIASYTHDHQFSRLTQVDSVDVENKTYTLNDSIKNIPTSGRYNYVVVEGNPSTEAANCYHFVNGEQWTHEQSGYEDVDTNGDGVTEHVLKEDRQHYFLPFNQLVTGYGWGVKHIPIYEGGNVDFPGVTILGRDVADSVTKFEKAATLKSEYPTGYKATIGELFSALDSEVKIKDNKVKVFVSPTDENSTASGIYEANDADWTKGTLTFNGVGAAKITITDYYFCKTTTTFVTIVNKGTVDKFEVAFPNTDTYLYRVGNQNAVEIGSLFKGIGDVVIGNVTASIASVDESIGGSGTYSANSSDWTKGTITFNGTGPVAVTISDDNMAKAVTLYLEIVDAYNVTTTANATSKNIVLLNDVNNASSFTVSDRYAFYGNGFTIKYNGNGAYSKRDLKLGFVTVKTGGILDNVRIECKIFPEAYLYTSEFNEGAAYQYSAVSVTGDSKVSNCYIKGARNNIYAGAGNITIENTITELGSLSNIHIDKSTDNYNVTLNNVTTIQYQTKDSFGVGNTILGFGVLVGTNESISNPTVTLKGNFNQYNWVTQDDADAITNTYAKAAVGAALGETKYQHTVNNKTAVNMGIVFLNNLTANVQNSTSLPYTTPTTISMTISNYTIVGKVSSLSGAANGSFVYDVDSADKTTVNGLYEPQMCFDDDLGGQLIEETTDCDEFCYEENGTIKVLFVTGETKELDLSELVTIAKYTGQDLGLSISCKDSNGNSIAITNGKVTLSQSMDYMVTYAVTDSVFYNECGVPLTKTLSYSWNIPVTVSLKDKSISNAYFEFDSSKQVIYYSGSQISGYTQFIPFLAGLKIQDYDENNNVYTRFDGDSTEKGYDQISNVTIDNINTTGEAQGYHIVTVDLSDGGKLVVDMDVRATSGGSTHTGSIKVSSNVVYVVNDGITNAKGQLWKIYSYKFVGNNGVEINSGTITFGTNGADATSASKPSTNFGEEESGDSDNCVTPDTLITLADGSLVRVDLLTGNEQLLVWNMEEGKLDSAPIMFVDSEPEAEVEVIKLYFSDGTEVKVITEHGFWDYNLNKYVYLDRHADQYIGHTFAKQNGDKLESVALVDVVLENQVTTAWSPVTAGHLCYFVNGMLSMPGGVGGLFNIFDVDAETMTYDYEAMTRDIETYGLFTYEELSQYAELSREMFDAAGGQYLKVSIGKGNLTEEELIAMIERYGKYFEQ